MYTQHSTTKAGQHVYFGGGGGETVIVLYQVEDGDPVIFSSTIFIIQLTRYAMSTDSLKLY